MWVTILLKHITKFVTKAYQLILWTTKQHKLFDKEVIGVLFNLEGSTIQFRLQTFKRSKNKKCDTWSPLATILFIVCKSHGHSHTMLELHVLCIVYEVDNSPSFPLWLRQCPQLQILIPLNHNTNLDKRPWVGGSVDSNLKSRTYAHRLTLEGACNT
jgi:hypothetical protein